MGEGNFVSRSVDAIVEAEENQLPIGIVPLNAFGASRRPAWRFYAGSWVLASRA